MERLLQDTFGGLMTNVLSTRDGSQYSERLEPFFNIAMDVGNGKSGLVESLDDYFKEEPVEYSWETKGLDGTVEMKPLPTMKKVAIQKLPQHLIFNLRRFDFNFETFMLTKKNDRFEFPLLLDMAPYILRRKASTGIISGEDERDHEGGGDEEDSSILYELSGIVVHMGTADSGHYYSFSKERLPHQKGSSSVPIPDDTSSRWYEFNDSLVREFSIKDLEEEAFGGPLSFPSTTSSLPGIEKMKIKNAYFLLYDRKITEADSHLSTSLHDYKGNNVSLSLRREVHAANLRFWREKSIFSASFIHFMTNLLNLPPIIDDKNDRHSFESLQASVFFFFVILLQAGEKELIIAWSHIISRILRSSAQLSEWLLRKLLATENRVLLEKLMTSSSFTHTCVLRVLANAVESATNDSELKASLASLSQLLVQFILAFVSSKAFSRNTLFTTLAPLPHLFHPIAVHAKIFPDLCSSLIKEGALLKLLSIFAFDSFGQPTNLQSMSNTMPSFEEGLIAGSIQTGLIGSIVGLIEFLSRNISKVEEQVVSVLSTLNLPYGVIQQLRAIYGVQFKGNLRKALSALHSLVTFAISNSKSRTQVT